MERGGVPIELHRVNTLYLSILCYPGVVLTRAQLLEHVWGASFMGSENVVEVYIGYLRKKIDGEDRTPLLETVRGVGYRMG